jgi:aminopeptidase N
MTIRGIFMTAPLAAQTHLTLDTRYEIIQFLGDIAAAEKENWEWLASELPKKFPKIIIETSIQKTLNEINAEILASDDLGLINLFKRALRNHNSLVDETQKANPATSYYRHYASPGFQIPTIHLTIDVEESTVFVTSELSIERNSQEPFLILDGKNQNVLEVRLNEKVLLKDSYKATPNELILNDIPQENTFVVKIKSIINPFNNESLAGMYQCGEILTTQCEAEGARRIFFTLDRPDVLSKITTTIIADENKYPFRLSNGNFINETKTSANRTAITWDDPFPKPSYLFACVLGNFERLSDEFITKSGKKVDLEVYVEPGKISRAAYSLYVLKKAMEFDETFYDREYDLSCLKMVGIPNFNAGAMENKGLMIFNETRLLVNSITATDIDFRSIGLVVAHEYFHNWTGNRVTVRNFFEIALKEAFTDLRAMLFGEWMYGNEFIRPKDVLSLWENQFPEDSSEKAHPLVVQSYVEADSIYDHTTYTKGREVFRTLQTYLNMLLPDGFKKAQNLYFERYDGKAVTFKQLLECANEVLKPLGKNLDQFERWFSQTGTPTVKVEVEYNPKKQWADIVVTQSCIHPKTGEEQEPLVIPFDLQLIGENGENLVFKNNFILTEKKHVFDYNVAQKPIPVMMEGYSAPVILDCPYTLEELACLIKYTGDAFIRWNAGRQYSMLALKIAMERLEKNPEIKIKAAENTIVFKDIIELYDKVLQDDDVSLLAKAQLLQIPTLRSLSQTFNCYDFIKLNEGRTIFIKQLALQCQASLKQLLQNNPELISSTPDLPTSEEMQIRELRNACWSLLAKIDASTIEEIANNYRTETNFNNIVAAFNILINTKNDKRNEIIKNFHQKWKDDKAVFNNWLISLASSLTCQVEDLRQLELMEGYDSKNSNHLRSVFRTFIMNLGRYHDEAGEGYKYVVDKILEIASFNPMVAHNYIAVPAFIDFEKSPPQQQDLMATELRRLNVPQAPGQTRDLANQLLQTYESKKRS